MRTNLDDERAKERARHEPKRRPWTQADEDTLVSVDYYGPDAVKRMVAATLELAEALKAEKEQDDGKPADR